MLFCRVDVPEKERGLRENAALAGTEHCYRIIFTFPLNISCKGGTLTTGIVSLLLYHFYISYILSQLHWDFCKGWCAITRFSPINHLPPRLRKSVCIVHFVIVINDGCSLPEILFTGILDGGDIVDLYIKKKIWRYKVYFKIKDIKTFNRRINYE